MANARRDLPPDEAEIGDVMTSISRWVIELMEDDELADWFLDGLGDEIIEREERYAVETWDVNRRPWAAEITLEPEPYQCGISGRTSSALAVRLTHRLDPGIEPILMHPAEALGVIERGLHALDDALNLTEPMDEARQRRILARCLAAYRTTDPLVPANEKPHRQLISIGAAPSSQGRPDTGGSTIESVAGALFNSPRCPVDPAATERLVGWPGECPGHRPT